MADVAHTDPADTDFRLAGDWAERLTEIARETETVDDPRDARSIVDERVPSDYMDSAVLGEGVGRIVARLPDEAAATGDRAHAEYVVKFPKPNDPNLVGPGGHVQNGEEVAIWRETEDAHLLPVTAHDNDRWWVIMPRIDEVTQCSRAELIEWMNDARDALSEYIAEDDIYEENIGWLHAEDAPRLYDYGTARLS